MWCWLAAVVFLLVCISWMIVILRAQQERAKYLAELAEQNAYLLSENVRKPHE